MIVDRDDPAANVVLGSIRLKQGKYELAEKYLKKGVAGGGAGGFNEYAVLLLRTNRAEEAEAWARRAVEKKPRDWNIRETLASVLIELGRTEEAEAVLDEVARLAEEQGSAKRAAKLLERDRERIRALNTARP